MVAVATSVTVAQGTASDTTRPNNGNAVQINQLDPCTQDHIVIDGLLSMTSIKHLAGDLIHPELLVTFYGAVYTGPNQTEERVVVADHVGFVRALAMGLLEPYDLALRMVQRPSQLDTLFLARLQPFWDGTSETITMTETHLFCG